MLLLRVLFGVSCILVGVRSQGLSLSSLSPACQSALGEVIMSPAGTCLNIAEFLPVLEASSDESITDSIDAWLSGACSAAPCSKETLANAVTTAISGCGPDLINAGAILDPLPVMIDSIENIYTGTRGVLCLENEKIKAQDKLCVTQILTDVQNLTAQPVTLQTIVGLVTGAAAMLPANITCTDCTQAIWAVLKEEIPEIVDVSSITGGINSKCGVRFLRGGRPHDVHLI
ncbi:hypothetical protein SISSUDRAFT_595672 [Sistotremastrum suecicum HHB10207 ss-3]|uniref:Uncharacterized protein n=1 Tax=Sistotremastrum suecicum HHB10207 ss-3 TaxID=1314776 RepID=A0A166I7K7_9AGAM|nr:hypothetical protein SISSUDRAFT_595672 [Sistotremastrum suecicum HHB10207 ss-3]